LNLGAQREQRGEVDGYLWQPRSLCWSGIDRRAEHVKVVVVARDLDVELKLAVLSPAAAHSSRPDAELLVAHEVFFTFGEAIIRFGAVENGEIGCGEPQ
jgi:hypothetical protein